MSWSVAATGSAAAVKQSLEEQFKPILENLEKAEGFKHEFAAAALTKKAIEAQLNFLLSLENPGGVRVEASGTSWRSGDVNGHAQLAVKFEPIANFVG